MKRLFVLLLSLSLLFAVVGCDNKDENADQPSNNVQTTEQTETNTTEPTTVPATESPTEEESATESWVEQNREIPDVIPEFVQGTMKVYSAEEAQEEYPYDFTFLPKYRDIYYREPWFLYDLVDSDEWNNWCIEVILPHTENNIEPQEMYTVSFVKHFKISKEDFIAAAEKRKNEIEMKHELYGHEIGTEGQEIHNADIIYTFDNEIINNYYLRDQSSN